MIEIVRFAEGRLRIIVGEVVWELRALDDDRLSIAYEGPDGLMQPWIHDSGGEGVILALDEQDTDE